MITRVKMLTASDSKPRNIAMTDQDSTPPVTLSREALYELVWSTPLRRLAAQYGITGTGLAKICARLDVPCPPRGYWAKLAFGKSVERIALPEATPDTWLQATISTSPAPADLSPAETEAQQEFAKRSRPTPGSPCRSVLPVPIKSLRSGWPTMSAGNKTRCVTETPLGGKG